MDTVRILLVIKDFEEAEEFHIMLQTVFNDRSIVPISAHSPLEVLPLMKQYDPEIVILEMRPYGFELIEALLNLRKDLKIIGYNERFRLDIAMQLNSAGACGYFSAWDNRIVALNLIQRVIDLPVSNDRYPFQTSVG